MKQVKRAGRPGDVGFPGRFAAPAQAAALASFVGTAFAVPLGGYGPLFFLLAADAMAAALTAPWTGTAEHH
ncbi:hypothetical protein ACFUKV_11715 [Streptomyces paradoxus]|uniref:hypothetical protein n=1 Tax=Streptomyces paradoxus TaxID=66375 RepID=UPI0036327B79